MRTTGEINTDFFSPAQEASTRDDIPLHALAILSTAAPAQQMPPAPVRVAEVVERFGSLDSQFGDRAKESLIMVAVGGGADLGFDLGASVSRRFG